MWPGFSYKVFQENVFGQYEHEKESLSLCTDLEKNLFVSQAPFLRVEMCHQNSVIRDKNLTKKQRDSRHNLVPKHKNHAQKC